MEVFHSDFALALLQDLLERFKSLAIDEAVQIARFDAEDELKKLERMLFKVQALLDSFQLTSNKSWHHWVGDVTTVCYDAEDLVDDILSGASKNSVLEKILSYFTTGSMTRKIQELQNRLEDIINGLDMLNRTKQQAQERSLGYLKGFGYGKEQLLLPEKLFGRDADKENIISMLLDETVRCVSVVGMDGLGKTALARNVQYDSRIRDHFHHIVWVSVSTRFDLSEISHFILHGRHKSESDYRFLPNGLFEDLYSGKSILIVLDDLWDVKYEEWNSFRSLFLRSSCCKVLLTTSNPNVALVAKANPYHLQLMEDEDCCALIMERVLSLNLLSEHQRVNLEQVAGVMALKCKGLPLAANILGLLLSSKCNNDDWLTLSKRDICELRVFREEIFPVFRLNNPDLASHLRKCLAYCSLFPQNYIFKRDKLIQLWKAEGFLLPLRMTSLEEIGNDYFDELLQRSVFQITDLHQETPTYKMHEFIHRFAEFVASETHLQLKEGEWSCSNPSYNKARHLSLLCDIIKLPFLLNVEKCDGLRTFLLLNENGTRIGKVPYSLFRKLVRLRVLDLSNSDIDELPESLGRLEHLGYLDASQTPIQRLPKSTSDLVRLQVLKLSNCSKLLELPKDIKTLTSLVHLDVDKKVLRCRPNCIGNLRYLKTLPAFFVGKDEGHRITQLKYLKFLSGTICLSDLGKVKNGAEASEALICDKPFIKKLRLEWRSRCKSETIAMNILGGLEPHNSLKELEVINYGGSSFPSWITSPSCMIVSIYLQHCRNICILPSFGQLPFLKTLHIEGLGLVKEVDHHFCGEGTNKAFPSLKLLKIQNMVDLMRWCSVPENSMSQLCNLVLEDCPNLSSIQSLKHMNLLQTFEINQCTKLISLPELPSSIQSLIIIESDMVKQSCQPEGGPQWLNIEAIPYVEIDDIIVNGDSSDGTSPQNTLSVLADAGTWTLSAK